MRAMHDADRFAEGVQGRVEAIVAIQPIICGKMDAGHDAHPLQTPAIEAGLSHLFPKCKHIESAERANL